MPDFFHVGQCVVPPSGAFPSGLRWWHIVSSVGEGCLFPPVKFSAPTTSLMAWFCAFSNRARTAGDAVQAKFFGTPSKARCFRNPVFPCPQFPMLSVHQNLLHIHALGCLQFIVVVGAAHLRKNALLNFFSMEMPTPFS